MFSNIEPRNGTENKFTEISPPFRISIRIRHYFEAPAVVLFLSSSIQGVGRTFFPDTDAKTSPDPPAPPFPIKRHDLGILAQKQKISGPKLVTRIFGAKKSKCGAKFKYHRQNSN